MDKKKRGKGVSAKKAKGARREAPEDLAAVDQQAQSVKGGPLGGQVVGFGPYSSTPTRRSDA
jgi:hypothetical protein